MTEDEAKGTWCPEVRIIFVDGWFTSNRGDEGSNIEDVNVCCWASKCQWWVWEERVFRLDLNRFMEEGETISSDEIPHEMRPYPSSGHCGAVK